MKGINLKKRYHTARTRDAKYPKLPKTEKKTQQQQQQYENPSHEKVKDILKCSSA